MTCLSRQHTSLMFAFLLGAVAMGMYVHDVFGELGSGAGLQGVTIFGIAATLVALACNVVVLINFEDIDVVQKLEREVQELQEQNQQVGEQREKMKEFWSSAQNLTELWLYRTVPRLDLYKELHSQLEDEPEEDLLTHISGANNALQDLEDKLGELEYWRNDGQLKTV